MENKKYGIKITISIAIIGLLIISTLISSVTATGIIADYEQTQIQSLLSTRPLNSSFMKDIQIMLTNIIDDGTYWRGKQFGTPGELLAAQNLQSIWNSKIKAGHSYIDNAELDLVSDDYNSYLGTANKDDFKLILYGINNNPLVVEYPECSPVHTLEVTTHEFQNAEVHLVPDSWYNVPFGGYESSDYQGEIAATGMGSVAQSGSTQTSEIGSTGEVSTFGQDYNAIQQSSSNYHIYLIENSKFSDHTYEFMLFVETMKILSAVPFDDFPTADAFILADINDNAHLDCLTPGLVPGIIINGSLGNIIKSKINSNGEGSITAYFKVKTTKFENVQSYNVIGTINGEVDDIIIIGSHYDSVWGPSAADDAGSNSVVWGIAKYLADNNIEPYYTLKFVAWAGEEYGCRGSSSYIQKYKDIENWEYVITLGALGYTNRSDVPKIDTKLNVWKIFIDEPSGFTDLINSFDYPSMSGGYGGIEINGEKPLDALQVFLTDGGVFAGKTQGIITLDKGTPQIADHWHHRDGENHLEGNTLDLIDQTDIYASANVTLGILQYIDQYDENGSDESSSSQESQSTSQQSLTTVVTATTSSSSQSSSPSSMASTTSTSTSPTQSPSSSQSSPTISRPTIR